MQLKGIPVDQEELDAHQWQAINESNIVFDPTPERRIRSATSAAFGWDPTPISEQSNKEIQSFSTDSSKNMKTSKLLSVRTYLQSFRYFERPLERLEILRQFEFPDHLRNSTNKLITQIQSAAKWRYASPAFKFWKNSTLTFQLNESATVTVKRPLNGSDEIIYVAVHMRLGDYHENLKNIIAGPEYFLIAATYFLSQYKLVCILIKILYSSVQIMTDSLFYYPNI